MEEYNQIQPETPAPQPEIQLDGPSETLTDKEIARAVRKNAYPNWKDLLAVVGVFLAANVLISILLVLFFGKNMSGMATFLSYTVTFALTIAFALRLVKQRTGTLKNVLHFTFKGFNPAIILWGVILMLAVNIVIEPVIALFPSEWYKAVEDAITLNGWSMFTAVAMAPICEEILFRGIVQDGLVRKHGSWRGILIASAVFGLIHLVPQQVVAAFCIGIVIGFVYYRTRSLLSVIVLHAINNALSVVSSFFVEEGEAAEQTLRQTIGNDVVYWLMFAVCVLLLLFSLMQVLVSARKGKERDKLKTEEIKRV